MRHLNTQGEIDDRHRSRADVGHECKAMLPGHGHHVGDLGVGGDLLIDLTLHDVDPEQCLLVLSRHQRDLIVEPDNTVRMGVFLEFNGLDNLGCSHVDDGQARSGFVTRSVVAHQSEHPVGRDSDLVRCVPGWKRGQNLTGLGVY